MTASCRRYCRRRRRCHRRRRRCQRRRLRCHRRRPCRLCCHPPLRRRR